MAKEIGAAEAAVAADHHQAVDVALDQVLGGAQPPGALAELGAARGADDRAAAMLDAADTIPSERADLRPALDHALVAFTDRVDGNATRKRGTNDSPHSRVHPLRVAAAGQDADGGWLCHAGSPSPL